MKPIFDIKISDNFKFDRIEVSTEPIIENMTNNYLNMLKDAEEQWYLDRVIEILESKGYTVTKNV